MSYLPELRKSLVKAAHREAEAPAAGAPATGAPARRLAAGSPPAGSPPAGRPARWRPHVGGIAAFIAAAGAVAVMAVALVSLGHRHAPAPSAPAPAPAEPQLTLAQHKAATRAAAQRLVDSLALPPGAARTASDPSSPARLGSANTSGPIPNAVAVHRFWRVPGTVRQAADWLQSHAPAGVVIGTTSEGSSGAAAGARGPRHPALELWSAEYTLAATPAGVTAEQLAVQLAPARGGGVAMRADGQAGFVLPRPVLQQVPAGVDRISVQVDVISPAHASPATGRGTVSRPGRPGFALRPRNYEISSRQRIDQVVSMMNLLPVADPNRTSCPTPPAGSPNVVVTVDLAFSSTHRSAVLGRAHMVATCGVVRLMTIGDPAVQTLKLDFPGLQASPYALLLDGLMTDFAPPLNAVNAGQASSSSSALHRRLVPPARAP